MSGLLDQDELLARAARLVDAALKAGADAADAVAVRDATTSVSFRDGAVEASERSEADDVGLRVVVGKRSAILSSNDLREDADGIAARAVAFARLAPDNPYAGLADPATLMRLAPSLDLVDPETPTVAMLEARARAAEEAMLSVQGVSKSGGTNAASGLSGFVLVTSGGFSASMLQSTHVVSAMAVAGDGTGMERDHDYSVVIHGRDLRDPALIGGEAAERAVRRLNPRKVKTCKVPVIFEARAAASLISHFAGAVNGQAIARKTSFLREKMGQSLFKPGVSIIDDPLRPRGLRSRPFDGEGAVQQALALIDDGRLTSWLLDSSSARELGLIANGRASRGTGGPPSPGATNLHLTAGTQSPEDMIKAIGTGLYVTDLIGQGVNPVTGDYSRGCSGYWIENGELTFAVSEVTIAGNLIDIFAQLTPANDLEFLNGTNSPSVLVEGLTLAGL
jgi:PmbA protein